MYAAQVPRLLIHLQKLAPALEAVSLHPKKNPPEKKFGRQCQTGLTEDEIVEKAKAYSIEL